LNDEHHHPAPGPLARLLGIEQEMLDGGRAIFRLAVTPDHMNPYGIVHGGVLYSMVDYAMGAALTSQLGSGERCATLEMKVNYLATVSDGELRAEAHVVDRTKRIGVIQARVLANGKRVVAVATGTFYIKTTRGESERRRDRTSDI
jgi:acyl-CoA thioesterase